MARDTFSYPLTLVYVLQAPKLGGTTKDETKALTKSVPLAVIQLGFLEGNKFWLRHAAFYEVQL